MDLLTEKSTIVQAIIALEDIQKTITLDSVCFVSYDLPRVTKDISRYMKELLSSVRCGTDICGVVSSVYIERINNLIIQHEKHVARTINLYKAMLRLRWIDHDKNKDASEMTADDMRRMYKLLYSPLQQ